MHLTPKAAPILCFDMLYVYFAFAKAFWALGPGDLRRWLPTEHRKRNKTEKC